MKKLLFVFILMPLLASAQTTYDTLQFNRIKPFKWHVTPRYDYSSTLVGKLFLGQALFDGRYKQRDNGRQDVYLTIEEADSVMAGIDAISLQMPKIIYLVGWQYNGHDSKYPALFEGNRAVMRSCDSDPLESLRWLMARGSEHHTTVSLHMNMFDCFEDSPLFETYKENDLLARSEDGSYRKGDWGYKISYAKEWNSGFAKKRIDSLCYLLPIAKAGTIHIDAYHNAVPTPYQDENGEWRIKMVAPIDPYHGFSNFDDIDAQRSIISYFDSLGIDVTNEGYPTGQWENVFEGYVPMVWHYPSSKYMQLQAKELCGGDSYGPIAQLFGQCSSYEGTFRDTTKTIDQRLEDFKEIFCLSHAQWYFLNRFERQSLISGSDGTFAAIFSGGVRSSYENGILRIWQDGVLLADGGDELLPVMWNEDNSMIAYSREGYSKRTWTLPEPYAGKEHAQIFVVSAHGENSIGKVRVKNGSVTLSVEPHQMLKLVFY